jgi:hypothetical protein
MPIIALADSSEAPDSKRLGMPFEGASEGTARTLRKIKGTRDLVKVLEKDPKHSCV